MSRQLAVAMLFVASLPLGVSVPRDTSSRPPIDDAASPVDHSATRIRLAAGGGDYDILEVFSGCNVPSTTYRTHVAHTDVGAQAEHEFPSGGYVLGVRGGVLNETQGELFVDGVSSNQGEQSRSLIYANPYVSREGRVMGLGLGGVLANHEFVRPGLRTGSIPFSGHFRLGKRHSWNAAVRYTEAVPLVAGGAYSDVGVGLPVGRRGEAWLGMGFDGPADMQTMAMRAQFQIVPVLTLHVGGYRGSSAGSDGQDVRGSGWHVGLEWQRTRAPADSTAVTR